MARESGGRGGSKAPRREQDSRDKGIEELQRKNAKLIDDLARTNRDLARTTRDRDRWKRRGEHLKKQLAAARRAGRRQAAPFAKDRPQPPSRPGRVRNRCQDGELTRHGLDSLRGRLEARLGRLIDAPPPLKDAKRFAKHLANEFPAAFLFLRDPSIDATNWRAEQAIRPAVVIRKVCGGNRTRKGADSDTLTFAPGGTMGSEVPGGSLVAHVHRPTVAGAVNATVTNLTSVKQPRRDPEIRRFQAHFRLIPPCKRILRGRGPSPLLSPHPATSRVASQDDPSFRLS